MRRNLSVVALGTALVVLASACGSNESGASGSSGAADDALKIGAWVTTSGPIAVSGVPQLAGTQAYFDFANANGGCGGRQVQWITKDNAYDPQQTLQIARDLVQKEEVVAIVSGYGTVPSEAALDFTLDQSKVPVLNIAGGAAAWYSPPRWGLFGVETLYEDQGAALGAWAAEEKAKNIVVVHSDPAAFVRVAESVGPAATSVDAAASTTLMPVKYHSTDYSPVVQQVKGMAPDAVVLILSPEEAAAYLKEAALQNAVTATYGYAPTSSTATLTLAGADAEGFRSLSLVKLPDGDTPELKEFRDAMAKYQSGQPVDLVTETGYARAKIFCQIVGTITGEVTSDAIVAAYAAAKDVSTGLMPDITFSDDQHIGTRDVQRLEVQSGAFVQVGDFYTPPTRG